MTVSTLRPNATTTHTGDLTGGATAHGVLSDDSDSSYTNLSSDELYLGGLGDLTLPAGAVIKSAAVRARVAKSGPNTPRLATALGVPGGGDTEVSVTWTTPTTVTTLTYTGLSGAIADADIDAATLSIENDGSSGGLLVYEAYLDVTHVAQPVVSADAPSGTVTNTNLPTVEWSNTLDTDGGAQTRYEVRVFTDAQYGAGGFDPAISTATDESGIVSSSATSWQVTTPLADDTYRAYVRVAQTVNGELHWSDWDNAQFDVDLDLPATPTLVATPDNPNGRIQLAITPGAGGAASTDLYELQRSLDAGATWEHVRGLLADGLIATDTPVDDFTVDTSASYTLDSGAGSVSVSGGQLVPSSNAAKSLRYGSGTFSHGDVTFKWTSGASVTGIEIGPRVKRTASDTFLYLSLTSSALAIKKVVSGTPTTLATTATSPNVATPYWLRLHVNGNIVTAELWTSEPTPEGTPTVTVSHTLAGGDIAAFGVGVTGGIGIYWDPNATDERIDDFTHDAYTASSYDYEAPNGVETDYRVRALHDYDGSYAASAWATDDATWASDVWWLKHPTRPDLNEQVNVSGYDGGQRAARQGVFQPLGATYPIVVTDTRMSASGVLTLRSDSTSGRDALDTLLDTLATLLVQGPVADGEPDRYVRLGDHGRGRISGRSTAPQRSETLGWVQVASPSGVVEGWP